MNLNDINWGTVGVSILLALITVAVPVVLSSLLGRKGANKKLQLDETTVMLSGTDMQVKAYQDLLNRATTALEKAEGLKSDLESRISDLEDQSRDKDWQITSLRDLFISVVKTNNIVLTKDQQEVFDATKPIRAVRKLRRSIRPT